MRQAPQFYVLGLIDHTHPTATQLLHGLVVRNDLTNAEISVAAQQSSGGSRGQATDRPRLNGALSGNTNEDSVRSVYPSRYSMAVVIFAVFSSSAETEQYFSFDKRTASSTALGETFPPTRYVSLISV